MNDNIYYVYTHTFPNGAIYVGKGKDRRAYVMKRKCNPYWTNCFNKYGMPIVEILHSFLSEDISFQIEKNIITHYKESNLKIINVSNGGEGRSGFKMSEEHKLKLIECSKNRKYTDEDRKNLSIRRLGKKDSEESRKRKSIAFTGRVFSEEHKLKISIANSGEKNYNYGRKRTDLSKLLTSQKVKGLLNANADKSLYYFYNDKLKISELCTVYELRTKYNIQSSNLTKVMQNKRVHTKGWSVSREAMPLCHKEIVKL